MATRDDIIQDLLRGETPYRLSKVYPRASVYRIYNELLQSGQLPEPGVNVVYGETTPESGFPFTPAPPTSVSSQPATQPATQVVDKESRAETVELGPDSLPVDAVNRIRGILGITMRPKVLSCPMPELLYPSMVIAVTELGFPAMRPDDFIDTVLYQWLEACDFIPFAYMKVSEIERLAKKYGLIETTKKEDDGKKPEVEPVFEEVLDAVTDAKNVAEARAELEDVKPEPEIEPVPEGEVTECLTEKEQTYEAAKADQPEPKPIETEEENDEETLETTESNVDIEPPKPTVGDLLKGLHIDNIRKEVGDDSQE